VTFRSRDADPPKPPADRPPPDRHDPDDPDDDEAPETPLDEPPPVPVQDPPPNPKIPLTTSRSGGDDPVSLGGREIAALKNRP
jgi:hypothetical protein